jgi:hypothetical protein
VWPIRPSVEVLHLRCAYARSVASGRQPIAAPFLTRSHGGIAEGGTVHAASVRWPSIDLNEQGYLVDVHRTAFGACGWWTGGMRVWFKDRPVKQRAAVISAGSALISSGWRLHHQVADCNSDGASDGCLLKLAVCDSTEPASLTTSSGTHGLGRDVPRFLPPEQSP